MRIKGAKLYFLNRPNTNYTPRMLPAVNFEAHGPGFDLHFRPRLALARPPSRYYPTFISRADRRLYRDIVRLRHPDGEKKGGLDLPYVTY